jgi:hypothetical protein
VETRSFNDDEWRAFEEAAPLETNVVGVRIRTTGGEMKLFRDGDYPVLRGTVLILDEKHAYLWTNGYVPQLDTYIGPETPNPLFITLLRRRRSSPESQPPSGPWATPAISSPSSSPHYITHPPQSQRHLSREIGRQVVAQNCERSDRDDPNPARPEMVAQLLRHEQAGERHQHQRCHHR